MIFIISAWFFNLFLFCLLSKIKKEGMELGGWSDGEDLGGEGAGETVIRIHCMKKKVLKKHDS